MSLPSLYKSPEDYIVPIIERVQDLGSALTDFNEGSVTRTFYEGSAIVVSEYSAVAEQLRKDSYLATATGEALTLKAADNQVVRKAAVAATCTVQITREGDPTVALEALTIPAGWGALATRPAVGSPSVTYITLADAVFTAQAIGVDQVVTVAAKAVVAGSTGNLSAGVGVETLLLPLNPVIGFQSDGAFVVVGPAVGGVDEEGDEDLRTRVPLAIVGRTKGKRESFLAAALSIAGVTSAQVLGRGEARADTTLLLGGEVELYYEGDASLMGAVTAAALDAAMLGQNITVLQAANVTIVAAVEVFVFAGADVPAVTAAAQTAVADVVTAVDTGGILRYSAAVKALHAIDAIVAVDLPFAQFRKAAESSGTAHDVQMLAGQVPVIAAVDVDVTVTELT